ncbi:glutathione S-transferase [Caldovatus sediminis]|uniref:Glutathione S-transferase n=1 Tax=Caldovatus sediminis TaxID=2041189 RepID=A0A8J3EE97_9PROT|nr:glutathione S-transferase family protein [Caldovatus sediminis]GGG38303.1 glutathione S-transferase [Caldovatus sediminis]
MTYLLYGDRGSGSAAVEMALAEIGAPCALRAVPLEREAQRAAGHLRLNPMGRIPVLVLPDGTVVTESLAILLTLCDRHPQAALLPPPGDSARATALRWMALAAGEFYPHVTRHDYPERFSPDPAHWPAIRARAVEMGRAAWRVVEEHAGLRDGGEEPFLLGARFSIADIYLAVLSRWMGGAAWLPGSCPRMARLARAVAARPAIAPVWERHFGAA